MIEKLFFERRFFLPADEAILRAGFTRDHIARLCRDGKIEGKKIGIAWYIEEESLKRFLERSSKASPMLLGGDEYLTATEAASQIGRSREYILQLCRDTKVQAEKAGDAWMIKKASLMAFSLELERQLKIRSARMRDARLEEQHAQEKKENSTDESLQPIRTSQDLKSAPLLVTALALAVGARRSLRTIRRSDFTSPLASFALALLIAFGTYGISQADSDYRAVAVDAVQSDAHAFAHAPVALASTITGNEICATSTYVCAGGACTMSCTSAPIAYAEKAEAFAPAVKGFSESHLCINNVYACTAQECHISCTAFGAVLPQAAANTLASSYAELSDHAHALSGFAASVGASLAGGMRATSPPGFGPSSLASAARAFTDAYAAFGGTLAAGWDSLTAATGTYAHGVLSGIFDTHSYDASPLIEAAIPDHHSGNVIAAAPQAAATVRSAQSQPITRTIIERTHEIQTLVSGGVSQALLASSLAHLNATIQMQIANITAGSAATNNIIYQTIGQASRIDALTGTVLTNITVHGVSGLTAADLPIDILASNYLPLLGGTLTGGLTIGGNATTTGMAYFAGRVGIGTTSPSDTLAINGAAYFAQLIAPGVTVDRLYNVGGNLFFNGTQLGSAGVSSQWATSSGSAIYYTGGNVGIGTTSPYARLSVAGQVVADSFLATTTVASQFPYASSTAISAAYASTTNLTVSSAGGTPGCATFDTIGTLSNTHVACGSGGLSFGYLFPGNATSSLISFNGGASTTNLSANIAAFGATATSSFSAAGALTLASALAITSGGTGASTASSARTNLGLGSLAVLNDLSTFSTTNLAEGTNLYFTPARGTANFVTNLAATSSVASITTLPNLLLPYSQLTGTPFISAYPFGLLGNATSTLVGFNGGITTNGFLSTASSTINGNATTTGTAGVGALFINNQRFTSLTGSGLSLAAGALTVSGLTTTNFASANVSQFTNDAGYLTSGTTFSYEFPGNATSTRISFNGGASTTNLSATTAAFGGTATTSIAGNGALTIQSLSGLLKATNGLVSAATPGTDYLTSANLIGYDFALAGNATSTLTQFNGGLTAFASSTIGNGLLGLTINGSATTTGNAYFAGNVGIGTTSPGSLLSIGSLLNFTLATSTFYSTGGINLTSGCFAIAGSCVGGGGSSLTGTAGQTLYFNGTNTTLATSTLSLSASGAVGVGGMSSSYNGEIFGVRAATSTGSGWNVQASAADNSWQSVTYGNGLFVAVSPDGTGNRVMTSPDGINWTIRTSAADNGWYSVTYGNGLFVAVAYTGTGNRVMTSPDGITWTIRTSAADNQWLSVTYGGGLFVAVAQSGTGNRVMTSPDGITWTLRTSAADNQWRSVTYGGGLFVAVANSGTGNCVMTSPDGINWTIRTSAADNGWLSVTYGNGLFVAVANTGTGNRVMTSPDGINWTIRTSAADNQWNSVTYGGGLFVAVAQSGTGNRVMTSPDGITWTIRTSAADNSWVGVTYGNRLFVAVAYSGTGNRVMTSGGSTTAFLTVLNTGLVSLGSTVITGANNTASSTIGNTSIPAALEVQGDIVSKGTVWTLQNAVKNMQWQSVAYGNGLFVAVGWTGTNTRVQTSPDGINWTIRTSAADNTWNSVTYGNGLFVAVSANSGGIMTSPDGINWTSRSANIPNITWQSVTYGNGLFVAVTSTTGANNVLTSPDGINWTLRQGASTNRWLSVTYGNGLFVAVSLDGTGTRVMSSPDGINWTTRTSAADNIWRGITYGNGIFVAVSDASTNTNNVMTSPDGITWTARTAPVSSWQQVTYGGGLFVTVSDGQVTNAAMTSPDGINWTSRNTPSPGSLNQWRGIAYGNGIFVVVGNGGGEVMTSGKTDYIPFSSNNTYQGGLTLNSGNFGIGTTSSYATFSLFAASTTKPNLTLFTISSSTANYATSTLFSISNTGAVVIGAMNYTASSTIGNTSIPAALEVQGDIVSKGTVWTSQTSAANNFWQSVTYGNGLFVAVAQNGTGTRVMTSSDGINWTIRTSAADNSWSSVTYGNGLFVAVSNGSEANSVMTSPDGINWTARTPATTNQWNSVTYGNGLFVAVSNSGTGNRVMTSPDGINWTIRTSAADNAWISVTYGNGLFVAVAQTGISNRVMTSPDGINWTTRTSAANNSWFSITYGNGLFVAVSNGSEANSVMTSPDGINWTARTPATTNQWNSVTYGNGVFVAVAITGTGNRVMTSPDGINWTVRTSAADNNWQSITYGNGVFVAVANTGTGNRVMTSGKTDYIPFSSNNTYQGGLTLNSGNFGIGTTSSYATFSILAASTTKPNLTLFDISSTSAVSSATSTLFTISNAGNVGIGTSTPGAKVDIWNGALCVDDATPTCGNAARTAGTIYAVATAITGIDLAERYPTMDASLSAGEIVGFDPANTVFVSRAATAGRFLGVVSTAPGIVLGGYNEALYQSNTKVPIALSGRVPVRVNLDGGPISVGDVITISSQAGVGARATTTTQTIGIALEPYSGTGTSTIQVFIKPELTLSDQSVTGIEALTDFANGSTTLSAGESGFINGFMQAVFGRVTAWLASAGNGIGDLYAAAFHAKEVDTDKLCVGGTCVTQTQFLAMVSAAGAGTAPAGANAGSATIGSGQGGSNLSVSSTPDTIAPVVTLNGMASTTIPVGSAYSDLGATITDNVNDNLGYSVSLDGAASTTPDLLSLDTSAAGSHTILFSATDQAGNTGTAVRVVHVASAAPAVVPVAATSSATATP